MALIDNAREAAAQARVAAEQGLAQVQAKIDDLQAKRQHDALLRDLGAAYHARKRSGGSPEAVKAALAAVDAHLAGEAASGPADDAATGGKPTPPPGGKSTPPSGGYGLDDV